MTVVLRCFVSPKLIVSCFIPRARKANGIRVFYLQCHIISWAGGMVYLSTSKSNRKNE